MVQLTSACVLLGGASVLVNFVISLTYADSLIERIKRDDGAFSCTRCSWAPESTAPTPQWRRGDRLPERGAASVPDPLSGAATQGVGVGVAGVAPATAALDAQEQDGDRGGGVREGRELGVAGAGGGEAGDGDGGSVGAGGSVSQGGGRGRGILDLSLNLSLDDSNLTERLIHGEAS